MKPLSWSLLDGIPCPRWLAEALDAHQERRKIVFEIWMLSDKATAFAALWLARAAWLTGCGDVTDSLRLFKRNLLA